MNWHIENVKGHLDKGCDKRFNNKNNLRQHQAVHTNKQFKCNECSYQWNRRRSLIDHIKTKQTHKRWFSQVQMVRMWYWNG